VLSGAESVSLPDDGSGNGKQEPKSWGRRGKAMKPNLPKQGRTSALTVRSLVFKPFALLLLSTAAGASAVRYVDMNGTNPSPPYTDWAIAARVIQDVVDAAAAGDEIIVTNGTYATGGRAVGTNILVNRAAVDKPLTLRSVNGPQFTVIQGYQVPGTTNGDGAIRCVYLTDGASLSGFTLTNGATRIDGDWEREQSGGGLWCESTNGVVSNCVLVGNSANAGGGASQGTLYNCSLSGNSAVSGGGVYQSTLNNCTLTGNSASEGGGARFGTLNNCTLTGNSAQYGGGAAWATLNNCTLNRNLADFGGGACAGTLSNCTLTGNSAQYGGGAIGGHCLFWVCPCTLNNCLLTNNSAQYGGGAAWATLNNCTLTGNSAGLDGGGAAVSTLNNCTLTGNWAAREGGGAAGGTQNNCTLTGNSACTGGGAAWGTLNNCILYFNTAVLGTNYDSISTLNYCCTTPLPDLWQGVGNISTDPQLASASHLSAISPCRGAGSANYATGTDIDGEAWATPPSIGCDECHQEAVTGPLSVGMAAAVGYVPVGFPVAFTAHIEGRTTGSVWEFGDGVVLSNQPWASHVWTTPGDYAVVLRAYNDGYPQGVSATQTIHIVWESIYDPLVAEIIGGVGRPELVTLMKQLTGAEAVPVGGELYTISNRCTTSGEPIEKATQFAFEQLQALGLQVQYQDWVVADQATNRNVIAVQAGDGRSSEIVVVGAHLDDLPETGWAPGADDNASGSAAVLVAARVLSQYRFDRSIHFVLFTGEEQGLWGSARYTEDALRGESNIVAALVADMIACPAGSPPLCLVRVGGYVTTPTLGNSWLAGVFTDVVINYGLSGRLSQPAVITTETLTSDQDEFWSAGFPAVQIRDSGLVSNHTTNDTLAGLDFDYFQAMVQAIVGTAAHLAIPIGRNPVRQPVLGPAMMAASGAVEVTLTGLDGRTYPIQASTDLEHWLTITNLALTANTRRFLDTSANNFSRRFYRAVVP
jgi:hypothetical protein